MRFACDKCASRFSIADEKIRGKRVAVRCSECGERIVLDGRNLATPSRPFAEAGSGFGRLRTDPSNPHDPKAAAPLPNGWYFVAAGSTNGPLSGAEMRARIEAGTVRSRTYVWRDGQGDWKRAADVPTLGTHLAAAAAAGVGTPLPRDVGGHGQLTQPEPMPAGARAERAAPQPTPAPAALPEIEPVNRPAEPAAKGKRGASRGELAPEKPVLASLLAGAAMPLEERSATAHGLEVQASTAAEPLVGAGVESPPAVAIGEQTRLFMHRAGVTRRNPPWKIAAFVVACVVLPVATLYLLTQLSIVRLQITTVDEATGESVQTSVFSSDGLGGLRDMLLGKPAKAKAQRAPHPRPLAPAPAPARAAAPSQAVDDGPIIQRPTIEFDRLSPEEHKSAAEIYADGAKKIADPRLRHEKAEVMAIDGATGGLDAKVINAAVAKNLRAFQTCNDAELRRNPSFRGGKVRVTFTIGPSGTVTRASLDRPEIDSTTLGACLREKAKRVVFPSFEGEPFDVEIPLVLTAAQ